MDPIVRMLEENSIPVTRNNYIKLNWPDGVDEDDWTAEHEMSLPEELRKVMDWSD